MGAKDKKISEVIYDIACRMCGKENVHPEFVYMADKELSEYFKTVKARN